MRWNVHGTDVNTGRPTKVSIEAPSLAEARALARYNGIAVDEPGKPPAAAAPLAYARPRDPEPPAQPPVVVRVQGGMNSMQRAGAMASVFCTAVIVAGMWQMDRTGTGAGSPSAQSVGIGFVGLCVSLLLFAAGRMRQ